MIKSFDIVVIGSGPGGYVAAIRAAQLGFKTACIEKEKSLGGTCLNVGCIPSKTLLHTSELFSWIKYHSNEVGISTQSTEIDFPKMMARKSDVVHGLTNGIAFLFKKNKVEHIAGTASFTTPTQIKIAPSGETIEAKYFILATGSEPISLPFLPFDESQIVSSTGALSLASVPKKLIVIGAGVIGVELASVYNRLGSEVTILEMLDIVCPAMDEAISKGLYQSLTKQGIAFHLGAKVTQGEKINGEVAITFQKGNQKEVLNGNTILIAIGRRPYTSHLNLEHIGIKTEKGFVLIDGNFRTNLPHVFAIGDLVEGPMLAHKAMEEGACVAEIIKGNSAKLNYLTISNIIYTSPEAASVGITEQEAKAKGMDALVGKAYFKGNSRSRCVGESEGFVKVIGCGKNNTLIGMHILGPQASELINMGSIAIKKRMGLLEIACCPIGHPTFSEAVKEACADALGRAVH